MKALKFSDAQKAFILKQGAHGHPVVEICRKAVISKATYFDWKKKYDGLLPNEMWQLKLLEDENSKLKKLVAEWPARYSVPDALRSYCMFDASSRGAGLEMIVSGAGGQ